MIERNIGRTERIVRAVLGMLLVAWVLGSPGFGIPQGAALIAAFALFWNSIFARCYLWKWLRLSSCDSRKGDCSGPSQGGTRA